LATALADSGELRRAFEVLERMFSLSVVQDTRAMATFEQAGRFYRDWAKRLAQESIEVAEAEVETLTREAERVSGFQVQFEEGNFGVQMTASTELAWKHGRDHHVIRVRESLDAAAKLHMRAHELRHIIMEAEARNAGTNRWFSSNESGWQLVQREIANELGPIRRTLPPPRAEELIERLFKGLMAQLYNLPLDIAHRAPDRDAASRASPRPDSGDRGPARRGGEGILFARDCPVGAATDIACVAIPERLLCGFRRPAILGRAGGKPAIHSDGSDGAGNEAVSDLGGHEPRPFARGRV
jgi:hypothetical protein